MTSEWMGLHNPERHEADVSDPRVKWCPCFTARTGHMCTPDRPCHCCVEAEAERLRALVQRVRELHRPCLDRHPQGDVQRCIACLDLWPCPTVKALDGEL